jgi:poly(hydroxyalkanoate) depolymerase family esterase
MTRWRAAALAAGLVTLACTALPVRAAAPQSSFTKHTYGVPGAVGTRDYWLYVPATRGNAPRPLVVFLHGCIQTAPEAAAATRFDALADKLGFDVVYPQQNVTTNSSAPVADGNGEGCWNWFLTDDQQRDVGEPKTIAGITEQVIAAQRIDRRRVYIGGVSAGADMAVIMGATYPDVYAAVSPWAGCAYASCGDNAGRLAYTAMGPRARQVPMLVMQGTADTLNAFPLGQGLVDAWLATDDWVDNGVPDGSVSRLPSSVDNGGFDQTPSPGSGDPCVRPSNFPCPGGVIGFQGTYPYTVEHFANAGGCNVLDFWVVHGIEHSVPDADNSTPFTDPLGPDMTAASYDFFRRHPMGAC